jgi:hypothetical protein
MFPRAEIQKLVQEPIKGDFPPDGVWGSASGGEFQQRSEIVLYGFESSIANKNLAALYSERYTARRCRRIV